MTEDWETIQSKGNTLLSFITGTPLNRIWRVKYVARSILWYLMFTVGCGIIFWITQLFPTVDQIILSILWTPLVVFYFYGLINLNNKRLHDRETSEWRQLLLLIPIANIIFPFYLLFAPGTKGENQYGKASVTKTREKVIMRIFIWWIPFLWILLSALLPRLQGAQDIARDTARQVALSQIQTATMSYKSLKWKRPMQRATWTRNLNILVQEGLLTTIPSDPNTTEIRNAITGVDLYSDFIYYPVQKNEIENEWIVLATRMETRQKANYVSNTPNHLDLNDDYANIFPCKEVKLKNWSTTVWGINNTRSGDNVCIATQPEQLWYIVKF